MEENNHLTQGYNTSIEPPLSSCRFCVQYLGSILMHHLHSQTMQPWVMAEIYRSKKSSKDVIFEVVGETICVSNKDTSPEEKLLMFEHNLKAVTRFAKLHQDPKCFAYLTQQQLGADFFCHVYLADSEEVIPQIFQVLRGASKGIIPRSASGETSSQSSMDSSSHLTDGEDAVSAKSLFEVKYVGKAKVSGKKVTSDDIDSMAEKMIAKLQIEEKIDEERRASLTNDASIQAVPHILDGDLDTERYGMDKLKSSTYKCSTDASLSCTVAEVLCDVAIQTLSNPVPIEDSKYLTDQSEAMDSNLQGDRAFRKDRQSRSPEQDGSYPDKELSKAQRNLWSSSSLIDTSFHSSQPEDKAGTEITLPFNELSKGGICQDGINSQNTFDSANKKQEAGQVMVLQISQQKITLISLDKKMAILECKFKDISSVSQGSQKQDMFGVVARESESSFSCYILRCLSGSMVVNIMSTLQMEFTNAYKDRGTSTTTGAGPAQQQVCSSCPLHQLHRICQEINTMSSQSAYELLVKRVQHLPDKELSELNSYLKVEQPESFEESVEVMMIFLHQMCERKQKEHVHFSESNKSCRSGTGMQDDRQNLFEGFKGKTRRSFTTSFESLLSRGKRKDGGTRNISWTTDSDTSSWTSGDSSTTSTPDTSPMSREFHHSYPSPPCSPGPVRKRSATLDSALSLQSGIQVDRRRDVNHNKAFGTRKTAVRSADNTPKRMNSLLSSAGSSPQKDSSSFPSQKHPSGSWRKVIFNRVCTPQHSSDYDEDHSLSKLHNREEIRATWKKAILETLLLIRLEKENHSIQARQEDGETGPSRKLDYQELTPCLKEITSVWRKMLLLQGRKEEEDCVDGRKTLPKAKLVECVKKGIPRSLRGQIWLFLMLQQQQMGGAVPESSCSATNYQELLKQLTTHQHAILIDLGRTFPNHPYFSTSLGAGQLELFNLLKAYSLLDAEVGYCQGLSFIVGMLLMHMEEISAFQVLKYIMYDLGLRQQFRPNMMALQVKLYQLTRLLHDHYKDVYDHFERHEISPSLYAAPWFLTLFASQFPLGFVARVFDMIFVQGISALLKVALMLIGNHRALILQCDSFETVVDFLKITLPEMVQVQMERIINQAFELDIEKELLAYEVEYHVLSEEATFSAPHQLFRQQQQHNQQSKVQTPSTGVVVGNQSRRVERRRMSIDLEMLYRLENHNRALKNQNLELLEKLQQAQCLRESCEHSVLAHQVERDKLRSHIQTLELERAALLTAVAKLQALVPQDALQHLSIPHRAAFPITSTDSHLVKVSGKENIGNIELAHSQISPGKEHCLGHGQLVHSQAGLGKEHLGNGELAHSHTCSAHSAKAVDLMTSISDNSKDPVQMTSFNDTPIKCPSRDSLISADAACLISSLKGDEVLTSPAMEIHITEMNPQNTPIITCGLDGIIISQPSLGDTSESVTGLMPSSSTLPSSAATLSGKKDELRTKTLPVRSVSQADSHKSTSVSSSRQLYSSRSISNVSCNRSAIGLITPEERRKSVKVVVQHCHATTNLHQEPGSRR